MTTANKIHSFDQQIRPVAAKAAKTIVKIGWSTQKTNVATAASLNKGLDSG